MSDLVEFRTRKDLCMRSINGYPSLVSGVVGIKSAIEPVGVVLGVVLLDGVGLGFLVSFGWGGLLITLIA